MDLALQIRDTGNETESAANIRGIERVGEKNVGLAGADLFNLKFCIES